MKRTLSAVLVAGLSALVVSVAAPQSAEAQVVVVRRPAPVVVVRRPPPVVVVRRPAPAVVVRPAPRVVVVH